MSFKENSKIFRGVTTSLFLMVVALVSFAAPAFAQKSGPSILVDMADGSVLAEDRPHHRWYPASLTKLMTAYVAFRAIGRGDIQPGSPVVISKLAARQPPSRMGYKPGVQLRLDTALKIIIIKSANDVSHALAEAVSGSRQNFVSEMNAEARRLGMINTQFENPHGLHSAKQFTSARDMALLTRALLREFPQYAAWFQAPAIETSVKKHYSYNLLLERFPGTTGMKTGFVCASGYNMVASAKRGERHLVAVVLGRSSQTDRAVSAAKLLTEGFSGVHAPAYKIDRAGRIGETALNMRPVLCTEAARKKRYDPAGGQAVIKSKYLEPRKTSSNVISIRTGGVDAPPSAAYLARASIPRGKVAVPTVRPEYVVRNVDGEQVQAAISDGNLAIPTPRPN